MPGQSTPFPYDVLGWPYADAHGGWLIFRSGPSELGIHPTASTAAAESSSHVPRHHEITLMCDNIEATRAELEARGATFSTGIEDAGFGRVMAMIIPGGGDMLVYQPRHPIAHSL